MTAEVNALVCKSLTEDLSGLSFEKIKIKDLTSNDLLIKVKAASVNFPDLLMSKGLYQHKPTLPFVLGMEGSGVVKGLGKDVKNFQEGDEVVFGSWGNGTFAEEIIMPQELVRKKPTPFSFSEAAAFQTAYLTAYVSLIRRGQLQKGENLLVHGSTGGVGMAAVQLGNFLGANVIATGTSENKLEQTLEWGASHKILTYKEGKTQFRQEVKALTDGLGADVIYDPVGGDVFDESIRCINWGGRILIVGFASGRIPTAPINMPLIKGFSIIGVRAGEYGRRDPIKGEENSQEIFRLAEGGHLRPYICKEFSLKDAKESLKYLSARKLLGKIVVVMD
tara:strand:- start:10674 stop:11678 length:1005 start_codon:yes stop_codon:yes gene_type:complete